MKRLLLAAAFVTALAACSSAQQQTAAGDLAKLQTTVVNGCTVMQPTLESIAALDPAVAAAATANGLFCATASAITVTSVQTLLTTGIPAIDQAINASTLIPANQKPLFVAAIGVFELTVQNAMSVYGQSSTAPASTPAAASAPAASQ